MSKEFLEVLTAARTAHSTGHPQDKTNGTPRAAKEAVKDMAEKKVDEIEGGKRANQELDAKHDEKKARTYKQDVNKLIGKFNFHANAARLHLGHAAKLEKAEARAIRTKDAPTAVRARKERDAHLQYAFHHINEARKLRKAKGRPLVALDKETFKKHSSPRLHLEKELGKLEKTIASHAVVRAK